MSSIRKVLLSALSVLAAPAWGQFTISPPSLNLTIRHLSTTPVSGSVTITNNGPAVEFDGSGTLAMCDYSPHFSSMAAGASVTLTVTCLPSSQVQPDLLRESISFNYNFRPILTIPLNIDITPIPVTVSPSSLTLTVDAGSRVSGSFTVSAEGDYLFYLASSATPWLRLRSDPYMFPSNHARLEFTCDAKDLTDGTYRGTINIGHYRGSPIATAAVTLIVRGNPTFFADPNSLSISASSISPVQEKTVSLQNNGAHIDFTAGASQPWLTVIEGTGSIAAGGRTPLHVRANPAGLAAGSYDGMVTVDAPGRNPVRIPVTFTITKPTEPLRTAPTSLTFHASASEAPPPQSVLVLGASSFTLLPRVLSGWLSALPGPAGSGLFSVRVDPSRLASLPTSGILDIKSSDGSTLELGVEVYLKNTTVLSFPQIADGGGFTTSITLINQDPTPARASLRFFKNRADGTFLTDDWRPTTTRNEILDDLLVPPSSAITIQTAGAAPTTSSGFAQLTLTQGNLRGFAVFRQNSQEAAVPMNASPTQRVIIPFDNSGGLKTSLALANLGQFDPCKVQYLLRSESGALLASGTLLSLPRRGHHAARLVDLLPASANLRGTLELAADLGVLSTVALRFDSGAAFTSFETQSAYTNSPLRKIIPQVADGGGFSTEITLVNTGVEPATATVRFRRARTDRSLATEPWTLPLAGAPSLVNIPIPVGAAVRLSTLNTGATPISGLAEIESNQPLGGFAVFRLVRPGASTQEAAVPIADPRAGLFGLAFDNTNGFVTSAAFVNPSPTQPARIEITVRDENGATAATDFLDLPPLGHTAIELNSRFPATANRAGLLQCRVVSGAASAIGLRFSPTGPFTSFQPQWR